MKMWAVKYIEYELGVHGPRGTSVNKYKQSLDLEASNLHDAFFEAMKKLHECWTTYAVLLEDNKPRANMWRKTFEEMGWRLWKIKENAPLDFYFNRLDLLTECNKIKKYSLSRSSFSNLENSSQRINFSVTFKDDHTINFLPDDSLIILDEFLPRCTLFTIALAFGKFQVKSDTVLVKSETFTQAKGNDMRKQNKDKISFDEWFEEFTKLWRSNFECSDNFEKTLDKESYREQYNDGLSPKEAFETELDYG